MLLLPELVSGLVGDILFVDLFDIPEIYIIKTKFTHVYLTLFPLTELYDIIFCL